MSSKKRIDIELKKNNISSSCDSLKSTLESVANNGNLNTKIKNLDIWLKKYSSEIKNEYLSLEPNKYTYHKGEIIYVDFGSNMHTEFSNPHYAIVLTKKDYQKNDSLTVLPLSSKEKRQYTPIGKSLLQSVAMELFQKIEETSNEIKQLEEKIKKYESNPSTPALEAFTNAWLSSSNTNDGLLKIIQTYQSGIHFDTSEMYESAKKKFEIDQLNKKIKRRFQMTKELKEFMEIINKDTYACINNVTTISKRKIIRKFWSPLHLKVSTECLNTCEEAIVKNLTNVEIVKVDKS